MAEILEVLDTRGNEEFMGNTTSLDEALLRLGVNASDSMDVTGYGEIIQNECDMALWKTAGSVLCGLESVEISREDACALFDKLSGDSEKRVTPKEISEWLGGKMTEEEISEAFATVMEDGLIGRDAFAGFILNARLM